MTVKPQQSEWLNTELFSAECGSTLKPCRVGSAELNVYPYIIPVDDPVDMSKVKLAVRYPLSFKGLHKNKWSGKV